MIKKYCVFFKIIFPFIIYFTISFIPLTWFDGYQFISDGDFAWIINFKKLFKLTSYVWDDSVSTGYMAGRQLAFLFNCSLQGYLFEILGFSSSLYEKVLFFYNFFACGSGIYLLLRLYNFSKISSIFASFFYLFSPYAALIIWFPSHGHNISFYCFSPLLVFTAIKFLRTNKYIFLIINLFISIFFVVSFANPAYVAVYILILAIFIFYDFYYINKIKVNRIILFFVFTIMIFSYWLLPFLYNMSNSYQSASNKKIGVSDDYLLKINAVKINKGLRSQGYWVLNGKENNEEYHSWSQLYKTKKYTILSFLPVFLVLSLFFIVNEKKKRKVLLFWFSIFVLGIAINNGYKGDSDIFLFTNRIFFSFEYISRMFRNVYGKLGILLVIPITILYCMFFDEMEKDSNKLTFTLKSLPILLYFLFLSIPFLNGTIIRSNGNKLIGQKFNLPINYKKLYNKYYFSDMENRSMILPLPITYNYRLSWGRNNRYSGGSFIRNFVNKPSCFNNMNDLISTIPSADTKEYFFKLLSLASIDKIIIHNDIDWIQNNEDAYIDFDNLKRIKTFLKDYKVRDYKEFSIYEVNNNLPIIYVPQKIIFSDVLSYDYIKNYFKSDDRLGLYYSKDYFKYNNQKSDQVIEFKKISPIKYRVKIHNALNRFPLILSESYHKGWNVYISDIHSDKINKGLMNKYKILNCNEKNQVEKSVLKELIKKGYVTELGNGETKTRYHVNEKNEEIYSEKYSIEFISKNYNNSIQNNNLKNGSFYETWLDSPVSNKVVANGFSNSWIINPEDIYNKYKNLCKKNKNGTYDIELIIEFWPQKLFYLGLLITMSILFALILIIFFQRKE